MISVESDERWSLDRGPVHDRINDIRIFPEMTKGMRGDLTSAVQ